MPVDEHPHAFLMYPHDFLFDDKVDSMTHLEFAAYMRLILKSWFEKPVASIPTDDRDLARMTRMSTKQWTKCKAAVLACFKPCAGNRLIQPRLSKEYQKLMGKKKLRSEAGKAGASARWGSDDGKRMANASDCHRKRMAMPSESHGIELNNPITHITPNSLTHDPKEKKNPNKGGMGENAAAPPDEPQPRVFSFSDSSGSRVRGSGIPSRNEIPWDDLTVDQVFLPFASMFRMNGVPHSGDLSRLVKNAQVSPARWAMLFMDKIAYAYGKEDGKVRLDVQDIDPVALTAAGFRPKSGKRVQLPTESACGLFKEIFIDVVFDTEGRGKRWRIITGPGLTAELQKRKGKNGAA